MIQRLFQPALASPAQLWLTILAGGIITYGIRLSFILLFSQRDIPDWLQRALRFVPPAVLTAIFLPDMLYNSGKVDLTWGNGRLVAGLVAILVAWRTKNTILTIITGMAVLWLIQWLF